MDDVNQVMEELNGEYVEVEEHRPQGNNKWRLTDNAAEKDIVDEVNPAATERSSGYFHPNEIEGMDEMDLSDSVENYLDECVAVAGQVLEQRPPLLSLNRESQFWENYSRVPNQIVKNAGEKVVSSYFMRYHDSDVEVTERELRDEAFRLLEDPDVPEVDKQDINAIYDSK